MSNMDVLDFAAAIVGGPGAPAPTEKPTEAPTEEPTEAPPQTPAEPFEKPETCPTPTHNPDHDEDYETCRGRSGLNADDWNPEGL
jgi:hypothetical protein